VRAAARESWQNEVAQRARTRRGYLWAGLGGCAVAASLVLAYFLLPFGGGAQVKSGPAAVVQMLAGPAWNRSDDGERTLLASGDALGVGSDLATGEDGRAAIRMASGHSVRLDHSTRIRLLPDGSVAVDSGAIYVDSQAGMLTTAPLLVRTPLGMIREIGTQFEVRLETSLVRVRLREGAVIVDQGDRAHEVHAGTELELHEDGPVTRREISAYEPAWGWFEAITPLPDLGSRTLRSFLEWVARERGWRLSYADEAVARSASEIVLSGTTTRMTIDQALAAVLVTSRMTHRVEDGVLVIESAP
jgi:ferric-dicitrate binding protein FerR (iron transport regulator)